MVTHTIPDWDLEPDIPPDIPMDLDPGLEPPRQNKRRRSSSDIKRHQAKVVKAILALLEPIEIGLLAKEYKGIKILASYKEAILDPENSPDWKIAIQEEIASLIANNTW